MNLEIINIIDGALKKDSDKVISYAKQLASSLEKEGQGQLSKKIYDVLKGNNMETTRLDEFRITPVDQESRMSIVDVIFPENEKIEVILPRYTQYKIEDYINIIKYRKEFKKVGLDMMTTLLLYGPPGCGKTTVANYISQRTKLPLITARLDTVISSLLGSTAKNIRKIFDYAKSRQCILFLDEVDAIAKARDDQHELGELKRVINSLLQNIDEFSSDNILIIATNHHELLDRAIWRRFNTVVEIPKPTEEEINKLILLFTKNVKLDFGKDKKKLTSLSKLMSGLSSAEIKNICQNAISKIIIENIQKLNYERLVFESYLFRYHKSSSEDDVIKFLNNNSVSQQDISKILKISMRQVRNHLTK